MLASRFHSPGPGMNDQKKWEGAIMKEREKYMQRKKLKSREKKTSIAGDTEHTHKT